MSVGFKIKQLREKSGWSQQELAYKLDVSQTKLCNIENDATEKIDFALMDKVCQIFNVDFNYFLEPDKKINNINDNKGIVVMNDNHGTISLPISPETLIEQLKLIIEESKAKDATIAQLKAQLQATQKRG